MLRTRQVRVPDYIWRPAQERAAREQTTMADVVRRVLLAYARGDKSKLFRTEWDELRAAVEGDQR